MHYLHVDKIEEEIDGRRYLRSRVRAGDTVDFGAWRYTITQDALECDCGKGVFCPLNDAVRR